LKLRVLVLAATAWWWAAAAQGASAPLRFCDDAAPLTAQQQDRLLRFAALVKRELDQSGERVALVARSGLDLSRFGLRYSHSGISLKADESAPWSVRQLYYACDEHRPRLFDQGMAGFLLGTDDPTVGYISIVLPRGHEATALEVAALDSARGLRLLAATYSANAYPFSLRYQNCNQWVAELLATAWGALDDAPDLRGQAQRWLAQRGYDVPPIAVGSHWLMLAAPFVPLIHLDDQSQDDLYALRVRTSLPHGIEAFVRERAPGAKHIEICHDGARAVIRYGWEPVADGCRPEAGDRLVDLDENSD
jgi:hypothetical protein